jgi:hypothetical protein
MPGKAFVKATASVLLLPVSVALALVSESIATRYFPTPGTFLWELFRRREPTRDFHLGTAIACSLAVDTLCWAIILLLAYVGFSQWRLRSNHHSETNS